jgi:hypothetical protein
VFSKFFGDDDKKTYLQQTVASKVRSKRKPVLPPIGARVTEQCIDEIEELHKSGSEMSDDLYVSDENENNATDSNDDEEDAEKKLKPFWKSTLRQEERMNDKTQLKKLHDRTNFLPNPRLFAARKAPL